VSPLGKGRSASALVLTRKEEQEEEEKEEELGTMGRRQEGRIGRSHEPAWKAAPDGWEVKRRRKRTRKREGKRRRWRWW